jgi:N-acetylneuraminic acid mutarotase
MQTVKLDSLPADLRAQLLTQQAAEPARVEPGLHASEDGSAFLYGGPVPDAPDADPEQPQRPAPYTARLAQDLSGGIEVTAADSAYPVKLVPLSWGDGSGRIMDRGLEYAAGPGIRVLYSFKGNGIKEDILLDRPLADALALDFRLDMDPVLEARLDGKGNLLVYGPDGVLGGFIRIGDDESAQRILNARQNAPKDRLMYLIPAPIVIDGEGGKHPGMAHYTLEGNALTLHASNLSRLTSPVTIDPSIVVTTTADFMTGNDEGLISFDTDAVSRRVVSGGHIQTWGGATAFATARYNHTTAAYNGFLYVIGGTTGSAYLNDIQFAPINSNGTIGTWTATTSFATPRAAHASAVYNGYLYVTGGTDGTPMSDVQFAPLNADGSVGAWSATSSFTTARSDHTSVAWNGYLYVIGGIGSASLDDVQVAPIRADGTVGAWTATTPFPTARDSHTSVAYNGFLYVIGGRDGTTYYDLVHVAPLNLDGTVGAWSAGTFMAGGLYDHASVAFNGYLYVIGGRRASSNYRFVNQAPLLPNGAIGEWESSNPISTTRYAHAAAAYGSRLYVLGGNGAAVYADVQRGRIDPHGVIGSWIAGPSFTTARDQHASAVWNSRLYLLGGADGSTIYNDVQTAAINADGSVGAWNIQPGFPTARNDHDAVAYNGYLYVTGGQDSGGMRNDVQFAQIQPSGAIGAWSATTSFPTARRGHRVVAYHGTMYIIGGANAFLIALNDVQMAPIDPWVGTVGAWTATTPFPNPSYAPGCAVRVRGVQRVSVCDRRQGGFRQFDAVCAHQRRRHGRLLGLHYSHQHGTHVPPGGGL